ncbi:hypothetical protein AXF42_Ash004710 [Apostasia shenzhenica]|uniref:Uncharacterized protein n=1 Tax=Apostasia shenzhenica TaxID=1088818 RepID=A0A2I0BHF1_9ASPA|nr:hypothetical protein AXF42_Ash004710 [Apostasia shenzhenica]
MASASHLLLVFLLCASAGTTRAAVPTSAHGIGFNFYEIIHDYSYLVIPPGQVRDGVVAVALTLYYLNSFGNYPFFHTLPSIFKYVSTLAASIAGGVDFSGRNFVFWYRVTVLVEIVVNGHSIMRAVDIYYCTTPGGQPPRLQNVHQESFFPRFASP